VRLIAEYQTHERGVRMCVYEESCSEYAIRRLHERGLVRGSVDAYRRYRTCTVDAAVSHSPEPVA
jgi:putative component of membrane protein insertase Oxa1/YidC/SpoIIIJ protein YidD